MKKTILIAAMLIALAGCNTVSGFGQDISGTADRVGSWFN